MILFKDFTDQKYGLQKLNETMICPAKEMLRPHEWCVGESCVGESCVVKTIALKSKTTTKLLHGTHLQ